MADIPYKNVEKDVWKNRSKEGTLPFVELDGKEYADSAFIIRDLGKILGKESMEAHINDEHKAAARAFEKLLENEIWFLAWRDRIPNMDAFMNIYAFKWWDAPFVWLFKLMYTAKIKNTLLAVGIGKHTEEEIARMGEEDLAALSNYLGTKHFLNGFKVTKLDACAFSVLSQIIYMPYETPLKKFIEEKCPNLREFCERIK
ncbi:Protein Y48C3A.3, partial [Aphelenchoides avenae]